MRQLAIASLLALALGACSAAPSKEALELAAAGTKTTAAASLSLRGIATDVEALSERTVVEDTLSDCEIALRPRGPNDPAPLVTCAPGQLPSDETIEANRSLARVVSARVKMFDALGKAYGALDAEGSYDARADLEGAVADLGGAAKGLSGALAAAGSPLTAGIGLITPIATHVAGLAAQEAQKKRLKEASRSIKGAVTLTKEAVSKEAALYGSISVTLDKRKIALGDKLLRAGIVDPKPPVQAFVGELGLGLAPGLKADDPRLVATSRAVSRYRGHMASLVRRNAYLKLEAVLAALIEQHDAFEKEVDNSSQIRLDQAINELLFWADALAKLEAASDAGLAAKIQAGGGSQ